MTLFAQVIEERPFQEALRVPLLKEGTFLQFATSRSEPGFPIAPERLKRVPTLADNPSITGNLLLHRRVKLSLDEFLRQGKMGFPKPYSQGLDLNRMEICRAP